MNSDAIKQIVSDALDLEPMERDAFARRASGEDQPLLAEVLSLLAAASNAHDAGFLEPGTAAEDLVDLPGLEIPDQTAAAPIGVTAGDRIGPYKLLQQIGAGGFGVVFMAEQETPVIRRVAIKVIKTGMDTKAVIARFEAERQALAMMDHPNIARVLDAGATATGRPYFVMELVKGIPITDYCDQASLDTRQRLALFTDVCRAVQHAHQKGIIHRDLKPSNVMVTLHDAMPVVKVIDFGIAKATDQKLTEKTLFTNYGQMIGTPVYMSPEQAAMSGLDVDTRSDVYSLGVLLYELLAGSPPFDAKTLRSAGFEEMLRIIRERQPSKPSTRISALEPALKLTVAARRQSNSQVLSRQLRGDLDWIVLKAIEKDRNRRYESPSAFAQDIQRYLHSEPITAGAPGTLYRMRKFLRRNRGSVAVVAIIAVLLIGGTVVSLWQALRATHAEHLTSAARRDADARRVDAERQQKRAEAGEKLAGDRLRQVQAEKENAENQERIAQAVKDFLRNKLLAQSDTSAQADALLSAGESSSGAKWNPTIRELLDRAAKELSPDKIEQSFPKQPLTQAELLQTIGSAYYGIGETPRAIDFLKRSVAILKHHLGAADPQTLDTMNNLAAAYQQAGQFDLALQLFAETLKLQKTALGPDDPRTFNTMNNLAVAYKDAGKLDLALPLFEETFGLMKAKLGPDHPDTLNTADNLAQTYLAAGRIDLALPLLEDTLARRKSSSGPDHPKTLSTQNSLALTYQDAGRLDLAVPLFEKTLGQMQEKLSPNHPDTLNTMSNLAQAYDLEGRLDLALPLFEKTLALMQQKLSPDHPMTLDTMNNLAVVYQQAGQVARAVSLLEETLRRETTKFGPDHPLTLKTMSNLGVAYESEGKLDQAVPTFEKALQLQRIRPGPDHPDTLATAGSLIVAYDEAKMFDKAEPLYLEQLARVKQQSGEDSPEYAGASAALSRNLQLEKKFIDAEQYARKSLEIRQKIRPDAWTTFSTESLLGGSLLGQQKYTEAEPLLLNGYQGLKQHQQTIPVQGQGRVSEALDRLIELYTVTHKPDELKKWQAERAQFTTTAPSK
jgi:serine/threonine protein kinase/Tfp pilus assembly protein PilF